MAGQITNIMLIRAHLVKVGQPCGHRFSGPMRQCPQVCNFMFLNSLCFLYSFLHFDSPILSLINHGRHGYGQHQLELAQYEFLNGLYEHGYGIQK